ncbi:MAG TPA: hypothetical protein VLB02_00930, partial [Candidatus Paceibacterota bacterium]|nr:hypothetical protein [Candidatus Paceibacterota bacterium]
MRRTVITILSAAALFFISPIFSSAYFTKFLVNMSAVQPTLVPFAEHREPFTVSIDPSFRYYGGGEAPYRIERDSLCNQYDARYNCIDPVPNLCPYLSFESASGESTEHGFALNPSSNSRVADGELNDPSDTIDEWTLSVAAPCFEGECPAEYDRTRYGNPLPIALKGKTFQCSIGVFSKDPPPLVQAASGIAFADTVSNEFTVSAIFAGATVVDTLTLSLPTDAPFQSDGADPSIGTANSTPFEFKVLATDANNIPTTIKLILSDGATTTQHEM